MLSKSSHGLGCSLNAFSFCLSSVTLLFGLGGFLRVEIKLADHDAKLYAVQQQCVQQTANYSPHFQGKKVLKAIYIFGHTHIKRKLFMITHFMIFLFCFSFSSHKRVFHFQGINFHNSHRDLPPEGVWIFGLSSSKEKREPPQFCLFLPLKT